MTMLHVAAVALFLVQPPAPAKTPATPPRTAPAAAAKAGPNDVAVTVTYKGKGTVDAKHQLIVWLFSDAAISSNSRPLATLSTGKNGDTVTFKEVGAGPVYVFAAFDQTGGYDGRSGPPPAGIPTGLHRKAPKGEAVPVKPGGAPIKLTFADSDPWNK